MSRSTRRVAGVAGIAVAGVCAAAALAAPALADNGNQKSDPQGPLVNVQLLSFNDFHGNLEAPSGSSGRIVVDHAPDAKDADKDGNTEEPADVTVDAGGVEYLSSHLAEARKGHRNTLTVAAGDIVGASPLLSAAFHDEPTILAMNKLGLDVTSVGNHEFDEGYKEIQRLANGGCIDDGDGQNNQNSCPTGSFPGASFDILAANVIEKASGKTILPAYSIKNVNGAKIGFIGMTLKDTPNIVTAAGVAGLEFTDEVKTANALVPELRKQGVKAIVVLIHQGGTPTKQPWTNPTTNKGYLANPVYDWACQGGGDLTQDSAILPIAANLDPEIDMIVSGHTHQPYVCDVKDPAHQSRLVTSASSFGRLFTETNLQYDRRTQDIVRSSVAGTNMIVTRGTKDPAQTELINEYKELVRPIASKVIGHITQDVLKGGAGVNAGGESQLGDLIADAQLADPSVVTGGEKPVIAFMNPGGIRADLSYATSPYGEAPGDVTYDEAFTVQPFNNYLVSMTLTGAQIKEILGQQWSGSNAGTGKKILQVSKGFTYSYTGTTLGAVTLNGSPLVDGQSYRIVTNNFLQGGGDGFPTFTKGTNVYYGGLDIDAFANYLASFNPTGYTPGPLDRITGS
ncbi:bifunctional metallophosphatase/5'-nucleotidase [Humibacillus xanthopallidus]|uniref:5'-nucleotidase n=1 Tax=Humibacillus xanthopallidus TaxID=412689 RepID=A0A543HU25_9MICO|nr:bifunctional metallophosphatase/5'-nucleotidase [Humibacillus xanthopallidus]TQM61800.1 5'-nucleotidase [Humibacillus xanthopallidus]